MSKSRIFAIELSAANFQILSMSLFDKTEVEVYRMYVLASLFIIKLMSLSCSVDKNMVLEEEENNKCIKRID